MLWRVLAFPRFRLITLPTPLERASRLGEKLGIDLWIKRDDVMELALGGNKARKLEFIIGHVLSQGYDTVVTTGALHSNHVRLTMAAARKAGLGAYAVLYKHLPYVEPALQGNILLNSVFGGNVFYAESQSGVQELTERLVNDLKARGKRPYVIPAGGANEYGMLGYVLAPFEILEQAYMHGIKPHYIVHASGTTATQAGLVLGLRLAGAEDVRVLGISVGRSAKTMHERILELTASTARLLGVDIKVRDDDVVVYEDYTFGGYGVITKEVVETIKTVGLLEGLILDPVYTAKAMYGLIDLAEKGEIRGTVMFLHTGGIPVLFQYAGEFARYA
ncbi:MAG: D-cysteine desulfhydrase family protein [Desulfurococcaceae archaeon]